MSNGSPQGKSNVALIISLCLNLILAGVIVMGGFRAFHHSPLFGVGHEHRHGQRPPSTHALLHLLPAETDKIGKIIAAHKNRIDQLRNEAREARRDVLRVFEAPDFSRQAFDRSLERVRGADAALEAEELKVMSEGAATLTPDERRAAAERARAHKGFGKHHRGGGHGF